MGKTGKPETGTLKGQVLVVDDEAFNRQILRDLLEVEGYEVVEAESGEQALEEVGRALPDVVLLDVMMSGTDGYEVCRRLKETPGSAHVPVLMVTALNGREDRLEGARAGADDFLNKPLDREEVRLRVKSAIRAKRLFDQVRAQYEQLSELEGLRDNLIHMIVHDLRSPLTGIRGYLDLLRMEIGEGLGADASDFLQQALSQTHALNDLIASVLDVHRLESGQMPLDMASRDLREVARQGIEPLGYLMHEGRLSLVLPPDPVRARCDAEILARVVANLVNNAAKFSPHREKIQVEVGPGALVVVRDRGPGIPEQFHEMIFEKFSQVETRQRGIKNSTGLGLTFCKLAVEAHGGRIGVESREGEGSAFWFELPLSDGN